MIIKISQEQIAQLTQRESNNYINRLYQVIVQNSPSLSGDNELMTRLKDADAFVSQHGFENELVKTDFLIMNAFEPNFYKADAMKDWLLNGTESVENEYIKYQQIRENLMKRGGVYE
ncbi:MULTISPECIES: hypothetical protein [Yersinia]|uniref:hypothetical protein n=1 Tax=Yersinia TaxID=629 RepID=UPI0005E33D7D|nr:MULTISPECIES: hypothetical protein [Yersinia]ARB85549.1 hypothetical protein A6J67_17255 [Yersinia sp. FDAARGOS_228]AVL35375.1 hypothetical protein CEQ36_06905 [Yersinia intermedia]CND88412.1 Uncharacterised protein [Yersinia intermedia]